MLHWKLIVPFIIFLFILGGCNNVTSSSHSNKSPIPLTQQSDEVGSYIIKDSVSNINDHLDYSDSQLETLYVAGGCFWGVEAYMNRIYGVKDAESGYANGSLKNPSYQDVIQGGNGFVEAVKVTFDPDRVALETLVDDLFLVIDPTSVNKQGNDTGIQYRTGIYTTDENALEIIKEAVQKQQTFYDDEIVTEVGMLKNYDKAEEEHQDYLLKNPDGYCHIDLQITKRLAILPVEKDEEIIQSLSE